MSEIRRMLGEIVDAINPHLDTINRQAAIDSVVRTLAKIEADHQSQLATLTAERDALHERAEETEKLCKRAVNAGETAVKEWKAARATIERLRGLLRECLYHLDCSPD